MKLYRQRHYLLRGSCAGPVADRNRHLARHRHPAEHWMRGQLVVAQLGGTQLLIVFGNGPSPASGKSTIDVDDLPGQEGGCR